MLPRFSLYVLFTLMIVSLAGHCVDIPVVLPPNASTFGTNDLQRLTHQIEQLRQALISVDGLGSHALYAETEWRSANFAIYSGGILTSFGYHIVLAEGASMSQTSHAWLLVEVPMDGAFAWVPVETSLEPGQQQHDIGFIPSYSDQLGHL